MSNIRIDWINHLVGFFTALIGIFIAFQLDDWQERNREQEKVKVTLAAIKSEIDDNREIYSRDIEVLTQWREYWDFMRSHDKDNIGQIIATKKEMDLMKRKHADRLGSVEFIKKYNDSLNVYGTHFSLVDVMVESGISTSSWEAAKSGGTLSNLDHSRMTQLTKIYDWIDKDLGIDDADVIKSLSGFESEDEIVITDLKKILYDYNMIVRVYSFKLAMIDSIYKEIEWEID